LDGVGGHGHRKLGGEELTDIGRIPDVDGFGRPLHDLRISVTDRCNFRCPYCMPREIFGPDFAFLPRPETLTYGEMERIARTFVELGVGKIRLTGGEPLVRRDLPNLVARLAAIAGVRDIAMTTNGALLGRFAVPLRDAGLNRVTVSLDSLDDEVFSAMNGVGFTVANVLAGIEAAQTAGFEPIKINAVIKRGVNESSILPLARYCREHELILRLIEYMDVGHSNGWRLEDVVPAGEILEMVDAELPIEPLPPRYSGEVANRWRYRDGRGEIGVIASVTQPFCGACTRARLSAEGRLYTCLFATTGSDLRAIVRSEATNADLTAAIRRVWARRRDQYSALRSDETADLPRVEMFAIGG
jgi:cyclic pyranopterin phosphate synthase